MLDSMFEDAVEGMGTDAIAAAVAGICEEAAPLPAHVQKAADARLALAHDAGRKLVDALTRFSIGSDEVCTNVTDECTTLGGRGYANRPKWTLRDLAAIRYGAKQLKSCSSDGTTPTPLQLAEAVELAALGTTHFELPASVDTVTRTAPPLDSAYVQVFAPLAAAAEALGSTLLARLSTASSNNYGRHGHLWLKLQEWTCNLHPATVVSNQSGPWRPLRKALAGCHTFALNARDDTLADLITDLCTRIDQYKSQVGMVTNVPLLRAAPPRSSGLLSLLPTQSSSTPHGPLGPFRLQPATSSSTDTSASTAAIAHNLWTVLDNTGAQDLNEQPPAPQSTDSSASAAAIALGEPPDPCQAPNHLPNLPETEEESIPLDFFADQDEAGEPGNDGGDPMGDVSASAQQDGCASGPAQTDQCQGNRLLTVSASLSPPRSLALALCLSHPVSLASPSLPPSFCPAPGPVLLLPPSLSLSLSLCPSPDPLSVALSLPLSLSSSRLLSSSLLLSLHPPPLSASSSLPRLSPLPSSSFSSLPSLSLSLFPLLLHYSALSLSFSFSSLSPPASLSLAPPPVHPFPPCR